jgi:hypothetical protein
MPPIKYFSQTQRRTCGFLKILLFILFVGLYIQETTAQKPQIVTTKGDLDGTLAIGPCFPYGSHKYDRQKSNAPMRFALPGITYAMHAHADFGNSWKVGVRFQNYEAKIDTVAMTNYLIGTIDTSNHFLYVKRFDNSYYASFMVSADIEKDITFGRFRLAPHANLGFTSMTMMVDHVFEMKERGSNYAKSIRVSTDDVSSISLTFLAGVKAGFVVPYHENEFFIYLSADYMQFKSTMALNYSTSDILGNSALNQYWFTDGIAYVSTMFGVSYYMR